MHVWYLCYVLLSDWRVWKAKGKNSFEVEWVISWFRVVRNNFIEGIKPVYRGRGEESTNVLKTIKLAYSVLKSHLYFLTS